MGRPCGLAPMCRPPCAGFESPAGPAPSPSAPPAPPWQGRSVASSKLWMLEFSAFLERQQDPDTVGPSRRQLDFLPRHPHSWSVPPQPPPAPILPTLAFSPCPLPCSTLGLNLGSCSFLSSPGSPVLPLASFSLDLVSLPPLSLPWSLCPTLVPSPSRPPSSHLVTSPSEDAGPSPTPGCTALSPVAPRSRLSAAHPRGHQQEQQPTPTLNPSVSPSWVTRVTCRVQSSTWPGGQEARAWESSPIISV